MSDLDLPLVVGDARDSANDCGCCEAATAAPAAILNRPGLSAIAYRIASHAQFKQAMLSRLSSAARPALAALKTRDDDDFSIALVDAWATLADVLTFYQERIANESYLHTATERLSVIELAALIGYRPRPGVAAATHLAFTLEEAPGAPEQAVAVTTIPRGTRVQSVPGPGETAQLFETIEDIEGRVAWNALRPRMSEPPAEPFVSGYLYLAGTSTNLKPGDAVLLVGEERRTHSDDSRWDVRRVKEVEEDQAANRTRVTWEPGVGVYDQDRLPEQMPRVFALRLKAALFGYNAPHPRSLHADIRANYDDIASGTPPPDWSFSFAGNAIDLDNAYAGVLGQGWIVLAKPNGVRQLYRASSAAASAGSRYALSGKTTHIVPDITASLATEFAGTSYRSTAVYAQSEELRLGEAPIAQPVAGDSVVLDRVVEDLVPGRTMLVRGRQAQVEVVATGLPFFVLGGGMQTLAPGQRLVLLAKSFPWWWFPAIMIWYLRDEEGVEGLALSWAGGIEVVPAAPDAEVMTEIVTLKSAGLVDAQHSELIFAAPLAGAYDRFSVEILCNIARATHGESVSEILGSGDARLPYQWFTLKQPPLTYVSAASASGTESTLEVRVGDVLWHEVSALYGCGPKDRVFITRTGEDGRTTIQFGDGHGGARLPSGQDNLRASYRKGIGLGGLVGTGQLSMLIRQPLGVKSVTNPLPATGAADPESLDDARLNAPIPVLTLERAVSLRDYEDFARGFAGVAKALATWSWDGRVRRVFLTVAGPDGAEIDPDGDLYENLVSALAAAGDPFVTFEVRTYRPATFRAGLKVKVDPDHLADSVLPAVEAALRADFAFDKRGFGQAVALSEVVAVAQAVPGVIAIDLDRLYRTSPPTSTPGLHQRLPAALPVIGADADMIAAELLSLDPAPLDKLEVMP